MELTPLKIMERCMLTRFNRQYESVFTKEKEDEDTPVLQGNPYSEMPNTMISPEASEEDLIRKNKTSAIRAKKIMLLIGSFKINESLYISFT